MFIETSEGRLQNLYLLQNVVVGEKDNVFTIDWIQSNGMIVREGNFATREEAETKRQEIVDMLTLIEE